MIGLRGLHLCVLAWLCLPGYGAAQTMFADTLIAYQSSGAGPLQEPYGGYRGTGPGPTRLRDHSTALDASKETWVSLPAGASITLGFSKGVVFDGPGDDLFICEIGDASELANVFVSTDFGKSFTLLGTADGGTVTRLDLKRINFSGKINAVRIVGLDSRGSSPGFDVCYVEGLEGSVQTSGPAKPAPNKPGGSLSDVFGKPGANAKDDAAKPAPSNDKSTGSLSSLFKSGD